jgi:PIN domain nuclease of toxin-antitoxin system
VRVLLDTHLLYWLDQGTAIARAAELAIAQAQQADTLFVATITAWEIGAAIHKKNPDRPPDLRGLSADAWFLEATRNTQARPVALTTEIAVEAAKLPPLYGSGDAGDCILLATAHALSLTLITRDQRLLAYAAENPSYVEAIAC